MWLTLLIGLIILTNRLRFSVFNETYLWGSILLGAGAFNVVEGFINHHLLQIHHVRFGPGGTAWDLVYLVVSAIIAVVGWRRMRHARKARLEKF